MITVHCISDLHGHLPKIPPGDVLCIAGDIVPLDAQRHMMGCKRWLDTTFRAWLHRLPVRDVIAIWGNHDFIGQQPEVLAGITPLPWTLLQDSAVMLDFPTGESLWIYGTPWTPAFLNWAFMLDERQLGAKFRDIPRGLDILMSHGPPRGVLDQNEDGEHCGSISLMMKVREVRPTLTIFGHIHEARGAAIYNGLTFLNVTHVNARYATIHGPMTVHFDGGTLCDTTSLTSR